MKTNFKLLSALLAAAVMAGCQGGAGSSSSTAASYGASAAPSQESAAPAGFDANREIMVVSREDGSGTRGAFVELFGIEEKDADGNKTDRTTEEAVIANKTDVMLSQVAGNETAIGYVSVGSLNDSVKALKVDGAAAGTETIKSGEYKIARPFNIATKGAPSEAAADFIAFILSKEGQEVVAGSCVPVDDAAASYAGSKPAGKVVIAGSSSVSPVMEKLKEAYQVQNPNAEIEIQTSDSTAGMQAAIDGICDIGMASRELKESELAELTATQIAIDGVAVVVSPENPIDDISAEMVKGIYVGEITKWSEVTAEN